MVKFLRKVVEYAEAEIYLDKPIESMVPLMGVLGLILEMFGGITYKLNKNKQYDPLNFLEYTNIM